MDQGSQFIVSAVEAKHGDIILDLCAGNGGKSLALASRLAESGGGLFGGDSDPSQNVAIKAGVFKGLVKVYNE